MSEQAMKELAVKELTPNRDYTDRRALSIKHQPRSKRFYFDVGLGSICLSGADTGRAYCLLEVGLAPGIIVPRHTHTREDEAYFVLAGELEVVVGDKIFVLRAGDTLMAPRDIPHQLRNSGKVENHYLLVFSSSGFEEFLQATAVPAPNDAVARFGTSMNSPPTMESVSADWWGMPNRIGTHHERETK